MGTRNLITVTLNKKKVVAQYCQWDGYPMGQGKIIADFLQKELDMKKFKKALKDLSWAKDSYVQDKWVECGADKNNEFVTMDISKKMKDTFPEFSRDTGANILALIQNGFSGGNVQRPITKVVNNNAFRKYKVFCEWIYDINLDNKTVTVSSSFRKKKWKISFKGFTIDKMREMENEE